MADKLDGILISEILADNAGGSAIDTDGDGNTNKSDEFIELQNATNSTISLDGFELWSEKNGLLYSFGPGDTIDPGGTATVVGNYTGTPPAGFYDAGVSEGTNWLPDGEGQKFDTIFLVNTATGEYITLSYGNPPRTPTVPSGFPGTTQVGSGESIDSSAPNGTAFARDANGDLVEATPTPGTPGVRCFLKGTRIETEWGAIRVEDLQPGMRVHTKDSGLTELRAVGRFNPSFGDVCRDPDLRPIYFPPGSIGNAQSLLLSGAHRVLLTGKDVELLFGHAEVLVPSRRCVGSLGICVADADTPPVYYHLLFDDHQIIRSEGSWVESLFVGDCLWQDDAPRRSWVVMDGYDVGDFSHPETARVVLKHKEAVLALFALTMSSEAPAAA